MENNTIPKSVFDTPQTSSQGLNMTEDQKWNEMKQLAKNLGLQEGFDNVESMKAKLFEGPFEEFVTGDDKEDETTAQLTPAEAKKSKVVKNWNNSTRLEKLLHPLPIANVYVEEEKYDEAYGILFKPIELNHKVPFLAVLLDYYKSLVNIGRQREAKDIKQEFISTLKETLDVTPKECELMADSFKEKNEYIKAILLYQTAEAFYTGPVETDTIMNCFQGCILGLKISVGELVKERPDLRSIVSRNVVPAMRRIYNKLTNMMELQEEKTILIRSLCLHHIETTELISENNAVREKTLREAIQMMDRELGESANKFHLYNGHLNNLAVTCMSLDRPDEAIDLFEKAIECQKSAEDYDSSNEREGDLEMSNKGLEKAREMLAYMA